MAEENRNRRLYVNAGTFIQNRLDLLEKVYGRDNREALLREIEVMARVMQASK